MNSLAFLGPLSSYESTLVIVILALPLLIIALIWWGMKRGQAQRQASYPSTPEPGETAPADPPPHSPKERLATLEELHDSRMITEEEYQAKRQSILDEI